MRSRLSPTRCRRFLKRRYGKIEWIWLQHRRRPQWASAWQWSIHHQAGLCCSSPRPMLCHSFAKRCCGTLRRSPTCHPNKVWDRQLNRSCFRSNSRPHKFLRCTFSACLQGTSHDHHDPRNRPPLRTGSHQCTPVCCRSRNLSTMGKHAPLSWLSSGKLCPNPGTPSRRSILRPGAHNNCPGRPCNCRPAHRCRCNLEFATHDDGGQARMRGQRKGPSLP
mmetsp:Transcript_54333/g.151301  ORF Transcript_54333/g.151301 Transcript_54333/m.151301 type:complete len:220 (+) Transcript_54333:1652-2311(+)